MSFHTRQPAGVALHSNRSSPERRAASAVDERR